MNAMKCVQLDFKLYRLHHSTDTLECLQGTMDVYATIKLHPATSDPFQTDIMLKLEPLAHGSPANRHTIWGEWHSSASADLGTDNHSNLSSSSSPRHIFTVIKEDLGFEADPSHSI